MSEGRLLAERLVPRITRDEENMLRGSTGAFLEGFLIGRFGRAHSRVALYNAAGHVVDIINERKG